MWWLVTAGLAVSAYLTGLFCGRAELRRLLVWGQPVLEPHEVTRPGYYAIREFDQGYHDLMYFCEMRDGKGMETMLTPHAADPQPRFLHVTDLPDGTQLCGPLLIPHYFDDKVIR